jgi:hypothetical protein
MAELPRRASTRLGDMGGDYADVLVAPPETENAALARRGSAMFVPHLVDPATYQPLPPPSMVPNATGKVPAVERDPRLEGAAADLGNAAIMAMPAGGPVATFGRAGARLGARAAGTALRDVTAAESPAAFQAITPAVAGGVLNPSDAAAAEPAPDPRHGEIAKLRQEIAGHMESLQKLGTTKLQSTFARKAASEPIQGAMDRASARILELQGQIDRDETAAKQATAAEAERKRQSEASFRQNYPMAANLIPIVSPVAAAASGYGIGRFFRGGRQAVANAWDETTDKAAQVFAQKGGRASPEGKGLAAELRQRQAEGLPYSPASAMAASGAAGATEGTMGQVMPTIWDSETLPLGSPNQVIAKQNLSSPEWWASRVAPAVGMSTAAGVLGGSKGSMKGGTPVIAPTAKTAGLLEIPEGRAARAPRKAPAKAPDVAEAPEAAATPATVPTSSSTKRRARKPKTEADAPESTAPEAGETILGIPVQKLQPPQSP